MEEIGNYSARITGTTIEIFKNGKLVEGNVFTPPENNETFFLDNLTESELDRLRKIIRTYHKLLGRD